MFRWVDASKGLETVLVFADGGSVRTMNRIRFEVRAILFDEETAAALQVSMQYFPVPATVGRISAAPPCTVRW